MNFKCDKSTLLKAINSVINGVAIKRDTILEGILINTKDNNVIFNTYNEELGIEYKINADVIKEGSTVVQAQTFAEIIRKLPDSEIEIFINENNLLTINCEGSNFKLATMKPEDFPEIPKVDIENTIKLDQKNLKNLIKQTIFAVGTDEKRKLYTGCLFDVDKDSLNVVAVDGFRLAIRSMNLSSNDTFKMVIPGKTLNEVSKILEDSFNEVTIGFSKNQGIFILEDCKITTKLLEGDYLNYKEVIKSPTETRIRINRNLLQNSFERVMLISSSSLAKEKKEPVDIKLEIGRMIISCMSVIGTAKEELNVETEGQEIALKFNPKFFLDVLKNIDDEEIYIDFGTSKTPTIIRPIENDNSYNYIILPIKTRE